MHIKDVLEKVPKLFNMYRLLKLEPYIGDKKTLVISTDQIEQYGAHDSHIFVHLIAGNKLLHYDEEEKKALSYFIEDKGCTQVIVLGSKDPALMSTLRHGDSLYSLAASLKFNLAALLKEKHNEILSPTIQTQMFGEFLVTKQCKLLMEYFFIKDNVQQNKLQVKGVMPSLDNERFNSIFYNGIVFNDLLTLN